MAIKPIYDERDLLRKVAKGDQRAFRIIYDRHSKKIYLFALRILNSESHAEEVMQETLLKLWQQSEALQQIDDLQAWLRTVARNRCFNVLRRMKLETKADEELGKDWTDAHNETEEQILLNDTRRVLAEAIALLPKQQRLVYQLCQQEGLKYEEAAEKLNLSRLSVQTYMKLALRSVRKYVSRHSDVAAVLIIFKLL